MTDRTWTDEERRTAMTALADAIAAEIERQGGMPNGVVWDTFGAIMAAQLVQAVGGGTLKNADAMADALAEFGVQVIATAVGTVRVLAALKPKDGETIN